MQVLLITTDAELQQRTAPGIMQRWPDAGMIIVPDTASALRGILPPGPDLILLDTLTGTRDATAAVRAIRAACDAPLLLLVGEQESVAVFEGMLEGADSYMTRPIDPRVLRALLGALLRRRPPRAWPGAPDRILRGNLIVDLASHHVVVDARNLELGAREYHLLATLAQQAGRVVPYYALCEAVWGPEGRASIDALHVYVNRLRTKLQRLGASVVIENVRSAGYTLLAAAADPDARQA